jgi:hypothetical protein
VRARFQWKLPEKQLFFYTSSRLQEKQLQAETQARALATINTAFSARRMND